MVNFCILPHQVNCYDIPFSSENSVVLRNICNSHLLYFLGLQEEKYVIDAFPALNEKVGNFVCTGYRGISFVASAPWEDKQCRYIVFDKNDIILPNFRYVSELIANTNSLLELVETSSKIISKPITNFLKVISEYEELSEAEKEWNSIPSFASAFNQFENVTKHLCNLSVHFYFLKHLFVDEKNAFPSDEDDQQFNENDKASSLIKQFSIPMRKIMENTFAQYEMFREYFSQKYKHIFPLNPSNINYSGLFYAYLNAIDVPVRENETSISDSFSEIEPNVVWDSSRGFVALRDIVHGEELVLKTNGFLLLNDWYDLKFSIKTVKMQEGTCVDRYPTEERIKNFEQKQLSLCSFASNRKNILCYRNI